MIRRAKIQDINAIIELENNYLESSLGYEMIEEEINRNVITFLVEEKDEKIIGYISGFFLDGIGEIYNFVVDEAYQRKGIGTALLNELIIINNAKEIMLEVDEQNIKGLNFYLKHDFKQITLRKNYYQNGNNAVVLKKVIR